MANGYGFSGSNQGLGKAELAKRGELADSLSERTREKRLARIAEIEDRVFDIATGVIEANLAFFEVSFDQVDPPEEWVEKYGEKAARQRLAVAKAGWMPVNQAPSAIKLAAMVRTSISRAYGHQTGRGQLNQINVKIALPAPTSQEHPGSEVYEVIDIDQ